MSVTTLGALWLGLISMVGSPTGTECVMVVKPLPSSGALVTSSVGSAESWDTPDVSSVNTVFTFSPGGSPVMATLLHSRTARSSGPSKWYIIRAPARHWPVPGAVTSSVAVIGKTLNSQLFRFDHNGAVLLCCPGAFGLRSYS